MNVKREISENSIASIIHKSGLRLSAQRIAVMSAVGNSALHPSAEEIYKSLHPRMPSLSRATVYNTLHLLCENKLLREIEIEPGVMRYDLAMHEPHAHFRCLSCGRITDVPMQQQNTLPPEYTVDSVDVFYKGICPECNNKNKTTNNITNNSK